MAKNEVVLLGCGDIGPIHEPMDAYSTLVRATLATGDIRFAQAERLYSERGEFGSGGAHGRLKPHMASVFSDCGCDVVSVAGNHCMDFGEDAARDTIDTLQKRGIQTIGAGRNLQEARKPAILERNGVKVAFLAYCSLLHEGHEAGPSKFGVAPMRAHAHCEPMEYQPGTPPMVVTVPYEEELAALVEDISNAKKAADVVVLSLHWGVHYIPRLIADYQPIVAKAAFKAGADLILGHHSHVPKGIAVMGGKVCFYSLGNFIFSSVGKTAEEALAFARRYTVTIDPDYPRLVMGKDSTRSLIVKAVLTREGVKKVSFLPVQIDKQMRPEVLHHGDPRFDNAVAFMEWASDGHNSKFSIEGDEAVITQK